MRYASKAGSLRPLPSRVYRAEFRGAVVASEFTIARIAIRGRPPATVRAGRALLIHALRHWPEGVFAKFLLLPGGFVCRGFANGWSGGWGWDSGEDALPRLRHEIADTVGELVNDEVRGLARRKVSAHAFGIDIGPDEYTGALAELAVIYDVGLNEWHLTGKSLPRGDQRHVVRVSDLGSHFIRVAGERVLVLGCHDLNIFSPRGRSTQRPRGHLASLRREMDTALSEFSPTVALQLPHGTDTPRTWTSAWNALGAKTRLRAWASAIAYYRAGAGAVRASFGDVCGNTWGGSACLDLLAGRTRSRMPYVAVHDGKNA